MSTTPSFDASRAEQFAGHILGVLNGGAACLMISIGHRLGLFDVMSGLPPGTAEEIAGEAGLNERYVREWLAAMVTAQVVEFDPGSGKYALPVEHAAFLTRAAGADNMAVAAQFIPCLAGVEEDIIECFQKGGGVPYSRYPRFHELMAEESSQSVRASLESDIIPLVPGLGDRLESGISMLDAGCGRGLILTRFAELYPNSRFTGMDLSEEAIAFARDEARKRKLSNIEFSIRDLSNFDDAAQAGSFDFVTTFDAIHDQAKPLKVLEGIHKALKQDGVYLMQDINGTSHLDKDREHPLGAMLYTISCMHCMTVSLAQGGEGLGAMWGEEKTIDYLRRAGFGSITTHRLPHDVMNNWYVVRK